jgi:hypothetical protein
MLEMNVSGMKRVQPELPTQRFDHLGVAEAVLSLQPSGPYPTT